MVLNIQKLKNGFKFLWIKIKTNLRKITNKPVIQVIGDSHSLLFQSELFKINYIGPATAFKLGSLNSTNKSREQVIKIIEESLNKKQTYFLFVFGEIDARIHIYNQHKKNNIPISQCINNTVQKYVEFLEELKHKFPSMTILICNIFPPGEQENVYKYPFYADRKTRMDITRAMNSELKSKVETSNNIFLTLFNELIDGNGERKQEYVFDSIHYNCEILPLVVQEINRHIPKLTK